MAQLLTNPNHHYLRLAVNPCCLCYSSSQRNFNRFSTPPPHGVITCAGAFRAATLKATSSDTTNKISEAPQMKWDDIGFNDLPTDYMYVMKSCNGGDKFSDGQLQPFGKIGFNPFSSVLNYGQGLIEGLKAYKKDDDSILLFRPEVNALRLRMGADRLLMPAPTIGQFVEAVKLTVLANTGWAPPPGKGFLYIRPVLIGTGAVLSLTPSPEFTFLIYVTPVGNYFEGGSQPINVVVDNEVHRAVPGGVGNINAIGNYAMIMKAKTRAEARGFDDVLFLDSIYNRYLEELSTANIFLVKDKTICTPALGGTILPGVTRESIIDIARSMGFQVEERLIAVEELFGAEEVFCTGNAVGVVPVGSVTCMNKRVTYKGGEPDSVTQQLHSILRDVQMGITEDKMGWICHLNHKQ